MGVAVSPDGRRAVSASFDHTAKARDLEVGAAVATFTVMLPPNVARSLMRTASLLATLRGGYTSWN
jgi:hypothetical protein